MAVLRSVLRVGILAATVVASMGLLAACRTGPEQWGPFRGRVVDVETGMPIAGAHVMVSWDREPPSLHYSRTFYDAQETVTDRDGRFEIERRTRLLTAFVQPPQVDVFAPEYQFESTDVTPKDGKPFVDPTVVKMRRLKTREEQCRHRPAEPRAAFDLVPQFTQGVLDYISVVCKYDGLVWQ